MRTATELLEPMVKRAIRAGIIARYILIDSWFAFPSIITSLSAYRPVICMLKRMPNVFYTFCGRKLNLVADALRNAEITSEQFIQNLIDDIMGIILEKMNLKTPKQFNLIAL